MCVLTDFVIVPTFHILQLRVFLNGLIDIIE